MGVLRVHLKKKIFCYSPLFIFKSYLFLAKLPGMWGPNPPPGIEPMPPAVETWG